MDRTFRRTHTPPGSVTHTVRGEDIINSRGKLWFGSGMAIMIVGILAFSGLPEIIFAVTGVLIASQGRKHQA